ncbi:MAG: VOC family protein [Pseudomonadales bacterium]|jgi:catechol 2,3-dioxygenase-like lactoylglutathione lyase family enzyme|nr:VOC family protein [Pseudomonadales bacterium]
MRLDHLALPVSDPERTASFWCTHFGLRRDRDGKEVALFLADGAGFRLALLRGEARADATALHIGIRQDTVTEVEQLHDRLMRAGIALSEPLTEEADYVYFRCRDPDGYGIEVYWARVPR